MDQKGWMWAELSRGDMEMLREAEETLGEDVDVLLAYQSIEAPEDTTRKGREQGSMHVAELDESQVECLQGLEEKLKAVVVAYEQDGAG